MSQMYRMRLGATLRSPHHPENIVPPYRELPSLEFDAIANFRDMGGHTTRDGARVAFGRLFRAGHLAHATQADVSRMRDLDLRKVFDFRTLRDIEHEGSDRLPDTTLHTRLPMPDPAQGQDLRSMIENASPQQMIENFGDGKAAAMMVEAAGSLVLERASAYRQFLSELAESAAVPALFHCSAGKDRAGWAGSLVLLCLDVDEEQVIEQYLLSNRAMDAIRERLQTNRFSQQVKPSESGDVMGNIETWGKVLLPFLEVRREYIEASFAAVRSKWGDFDRYLHEGLCISEAQRNRLKELLLE